MRIPNSFKKKVSSNVSKSGEKSYGNKRLDSIQAAEAAVLFPSVFGCQFVQLWPVGRCQMRPEVFWVKPKWSLSGGPNIQPYQQGQNYNQCADDLTYPSFEGFDSSLELMVAPLLSEFKIFPWILQHLDAQGDLPGSEPVESAASAPKMKKRRKCWYRIRMEL